MHPPRGRKNCGSRAGPVARRRRVARSRTAVTRELGIRLVPISLIPNYTVLSLYMNIPRPAPPCRPPQRVASHLHTRTLIFRTAHAPLSCARRSSPWPRTSDQTAPARNRSNTRIETYSTQLYPHQPQACATRALRVYRVVAVRHRTMAMLQRHRSNSFTDFRMPPHTTRHHPLAPIALVQRACIGHLLSTWSPANHHTS